MCDIRTCTRLTYRRKVDELCGWSEHGSGHRSVGVQADGRKGMKGRGAIDLGVFCFYDSEFQSDIAHDLARLHPPGIQRPKLTLHVPHPLSYFGRATPPGQYIPRWWFTLIIPGQLAHTNPVEIQE
jgi:hypothetical protein